MVRKVAETTCEEEEEVSKQPPGEPSACGFRTDDVGRPAHNSSDGAREPPNLEREKLRLMPGNRADRGCVGSNVDDASRKKVEKRNSEQINQKNKEDARKKATHIIPIIKLVYLEGYSTVSERTPSESLTIWENA